jgi:hypothetical protein
MKVMNKLYILSLILSVPNSLALPTFGTPPFIENSTKSSLLSGNKEYLKCDNWFVTGGSNSSSGCVANKQLTFIDNQRTFDPKTTSFSVRSPVKGEIYLVDQNGRQCVSFEEDSYNWCNITIILADGYVFVFVNNQLRKKLIGLININVQLENNTVWKVHCNQFMMSEKVTDGKPATVALKSTHTENSCFLLYVSLCEKCVLAITELNRTFHKKQKFFTFLGILST